MRNILAGAALLLAISAEPSLAQQTPAPAPQAQSSTAQAQTTTPQAVAADPARLAAARRVLIASGAEAGERAIFNAMIPQLSQTMGHAQGLNAEQIATVQQVVSAELDSSLPEMLEIDAQLYANHFTTEQLNALATFYESPTGQLFVTQMPALVQESSTIAQEWARTKLGPRIAARITALYAQRNAQQHP